MFRTSLAVIFLTCIGCKDAPVETGEESTTNQMGAMIELRTDLPLAKHDWSPAPPQQSSQAFMVPEGTKLLSRGAKVTSSDEKSVIGNLAMITDGNVKQDIDYHVELLDGLQWVQLDLGNAHSIQAIIVWHYYMPDFLHMDYQAAGEASYLARVYEDVVIQISNDSLFRKDITTIYNSDQDNSSNLGKGFDVTYVESRDGRWINAKGAIGRYVRLYSNGHKRLWGGKDVITNKKHANYTKSNDYIEVEVYGK